MIKAVIFDMFETLVTHYHTPLYFGAQMAEDAGIPEERFLSPWRSTDEDRTLGKVSVDEVVEMILRENNCYTEERFKKIVEKRKATKEDCFRHLHSEIIPMFSELKTKGIAIGLISNCYSEESEVIRKSELFPFFDAVYLSCEKGIQKPDVEIFQRCMEELSVEPEECIYVGDGGSYELETAKSLGMKAIQAVWYLQEGSSQPVGRKPEFLQAERPLEIPKYMEAKESIYATKKEFEDSFASGEFYNKQTQDEEHLNAIIEFLPIQSGMKILDLGTGSGYLAFSIAKRYSDVTVIGLDIVEKALENNRMRVMEENIRNLSFISYDGIDFPFANQEFDMVISRYALHHFPEIDKSISEVSRVLKEEGHFFISDPTPNANDAERFVDAYMQLKKDGHIKFYTEDEWKNICGNCGLCLQHSFDSSIRFPKKKDTAYGFDELLTKYDTEVIESYELEIVGNEIYVTEQVNNLLFWKQT